MSTSLTQLNNQLLEKTASYEATLVFFQSYLEAQRALLRQASEQNLPKDVIEFLESQIEKLEKNIDSYQGWLILFKNQLKQNESSIHQGHR